MPKKRTQTLGSANDFLTDALNRNGFVWHLEQLVDRSPRGDLLLIKVDIVGFKNVNLSYGYDFGDRLLIALVQRLHQMPHELIGRFGSNEFLIARRLQSGDDAGTMIAHLGHFLSEPIAVDDAVIRMKFAIGYVTGDHQATAKSLIRHAGVALHESKAEIFHHPVRFDAVKGVRLMERIELSWSIREAFEKGQFQLSYQPKVDLASRRIIGAEALLRWHHEKLGVLSPDIFIHAAEANGLIVDLGEFVFNSAVDFAARINRYRTHPIVVAVNVSPMQLFDSNFLAMVRGTIENAGIDPSLVTIELTEGILINHSLDLIEMLQGLRDFGIGIAIDDFGTGYSSLRYLSSFPISEIKIDKEFIKGLEQSLSNALIVELIVRLGHELGTTVTAEGIETIAQLRFLQQWGCHGGQGYFFGRAVPADEMISHLAAAAEQQERIGEA